VKLKQVPEDFKVEEISGFELSPESGEYKLYLLEKRGLESFYILDYLSRKNGIPRGDIGIAGLKDRHAVTRQYLTIPSRYDIKTAGEENFRVSFLGYVRKKISSGDLLGNRFEIVVRDLRKGELSGVYQKAESLPSSGVPNYFDSQRFGSAVWGEFIAKALLLGDYEKAVRIYLTQYSKSEDKKIKDEKRMIRASWCDFRGLELRNKGFARIVREYLETGSWLKAYRRIPSNLREMFVSAYQSFLWNECVKEVLSRSVDRRSLYPIDYNAGSLLFYRKLSKEEEGKIPATFKTVSHRMQPTEYEKDIILDVLSKEGLSTPDFDIMKKTGNFFKTHERKIIVKPADFKISQPERDELNSGSGKKRLKISVSFTLPKGSYATVITKKLFNR
jgi:tRNA pseudouridine13 synthase